MPDARHSSYAGADAEMRVAGAGAALAVSALLIVLLWAGLVVRRGPVSVAALATFDVAPPLPPPAPRLPAADAASAAAPAHAVARPLPIAAPVPIVAVPPPVAAAPIAAVGDAPAAGAAAAGPGTGAAGAGRGLGAGGRGDGIGGAVTAARHVSGTIAQKDYPEAAKRAGQSGTVIVTLTVSPQGKVTACAVARSSGTASLDAVTCRLALMRFRYDPARNGAGQAIESLAGWRQDWWFASR